MGEMCGHIFYIIISFPLLRIRSLYYPCFYYLFHCYTLKFGFASWNLKHKDSFGKSENLSKIFFAEILVFDHDYEGKSSSSNGLL